jgi:predicted RNase H-like HicB family nuclease
MRYLVVLEKGESSWGAHVPDLPGCVAAAETRAEVLQLIKEAIDFHIEGLRKHGEPVPTPCSECEFIETESVNGKFAYTPPKSKNKT